MLLVIPVSRVDAKLIPTVEKSFALFPPGSGHDLLIVGSPNVVSEVNSIGPLLQYLFNRVDTFVFPADSHLGWPAACNYYFQQTAYYLLGSNNPFMWFELDTTPLKEDWLSKISESYYKDPEIAFLENRPTNVFMGHKEKTYRGHNGSLIGDAGTHMSPCGVYPGDCYNRIIPMRGVHACNVPWYQHCQWYVNSGLTDSSLFQNNWRTINYRRHNGEIVCDSDSNLAWNIHFNNPVSETAVVIHGCKDGSLINVLSSDTDDLSEKEVVSGFASDELKQLRRERRKARLAKTA